SVSVNSRIASVAEIAAPTIAAGPFRFNCSVYYITQPSSWFAAQATADVMAGNLVTINSADENQFVRTLAPGQSLPVWIGLTDPSEEVAFRWISAEHGSYTTWAPGEPNQAGEEDFVELSSTGLWNDAFGAGPRPGVIEVTGLVCPCDWNLDGR